MAYAGGVPTPLLAALSIATLPIQATANSATPLPRDFHNLFVIVVLGFLLAWFAKVCWKLASVARMSLRLKQGHPLPLEGVSIHADDFQMLIRQHFNQLLRMRRTVPPKMVTRHALSVHLHPDSIRSMPDGRASGACGVEFVVDTSVPCCVKLFWGVSLAACNEFGQQRPVPGDSSGRGGGDRGGSGSGNAGNARRWPRPLSASQDATRGSLELEELLRLGNDANQGMTFFQTSQFVAQSREFFLPAGVDQRYVTPAEDLVDPGQLNLDLSAAWLRSDEASADSTSLTVPLVVVIAAHRRTPSELGEVQGQSVIEAHGQVSFLRFRGGEEASGLGTPEVVRQVSFGDNAPTHEVQGIFGFEDEGESECMICYSRPKNVLLLPCRHCSACHPCLRSLRDEKCPICRSPFNAYVTFPISRSAATDGNSPSNDGGGGFPPTAQPPADGATGNDEALGPPGGGGEGGGSSAGGGRSGSGENVCEGAGDGGRGLGSHGHRLGGRSAREVQLPCRSHGVAPVARTLLGFCKGSIASDCTGVENADTPLLQNGGAHERKDGGFVQTRTIGETDMLVQDCEIV
eukprot:TRINITY_DN23506_c0_g3_i1.p1 TRINITY_DN23506_c0_g3~~TRINITY_DN23506_c0_g3_i1.p1  ORF type:complete len:625 (+),score=95.93 TRINITY_DN23506_c0_g3_i1:153-1877(+)